MKKLISALFLILILTSSCKNIVPPKAKPDTAILQEVFDLVNQARAKPRRCGNKVYPAAPKLSYNILLAKSAQKHSEDMNFTKTFTHNSPKNAKNYPTGTTFSQRIRQEGYGRFVIARENIARGQTNAKQVVAEWLDSPSHCASIMGKTITETGLGHSGTYWTEDFAKPIN